MQKGIAEKNIIVAGFSQGGVMACELGLKSQYSIKAVVGLSCYLSFGWEKIFQPKQKETMPNFFLGHGSEDPIVPIVVGKQARDDLQEKNISVVWKKYEAVPHTVCEQEILDVEEFIMQQFSS